MARKIGKVALVGMGVGLCLALLASNPIGWGVLVAGAAIFLAALVKCVFLKLSPLRHVTRRKAADGASAKSVFANMYLKDRARTVLP